MKHNVYVIKADSYNKLPLNTLKKVMDKISHNPEKNILIKPNLTVKANPESGIITNPDIVSFLIDHYGPKTLVTDSPGCFIEDINSFFRSCGYDFENMRLIDSFSMKRNRILDLKLNLILPDLRKFLIVNVPKFKLHPLTGFSSSVKNLMGLIPGYQKKRLHLSFPSKEEFSRLLLFLYDFFRPPINVVDAIDCLEGFDSISGRIRRVGILVIGDDALAVDTVLAKIGGFDVNRMVFLKMARRKKIESAFLENIDIHYLGISSDFSFRLGSNRENSYFKQTLSNIKEKYNKHPFKYIKPKIDYTKCKDCNKCIDECPVGAISERKKRSNSCLACFHCIYSCPNGAIKRNIDFNRFYLLWKKFFQKS